MSDDKLEAIVAHEVGHGRQHHLLLKMRSWLALAMVFGAVVAFTAAGAAALVLLPFGLFFGFFLVQGRVGVWLEQKADDYACRQVGVEPVVRALEKLADLNMTKRRTGAVWDALQQHPGVERRVARLQPARHASPSA